MTQTAVIVPAAGSSTRFGGEQSKIFQKIGTKPMFLRTLDAFAHRKDVVQTLLVISPDDAQTVRERFGGNLSFMGVEMVQGGASRSESVRNALARVSEQAELVAIHDAARPCIAQPWIDAVFKKAAETGAAILAHHVVGTVKRVHADSAIYDTLLREKFNDLWEAQTPQVFRRELLQRAYQTGSDATDDAALVEALGQTVHVVPGDPRNIKITRPHDLNVARAIIDHLPKARSDGLLHPFREDLSL
jgi:2-C-methyl-D-erythritol 4-phosphate cytidylyltransferase